MLEDEGVFHYSPQAGPYGTAGVHDTVGILCGLFFSVECKADASKKMTALQERFWEKVEEAGGKCFLVYDKETVEQVREWIVSTRNQRQEGTDGGIREQGCLAKYYSDGTVSAFKGDTILGTAYLRDDPGPEEFRVQCILPNPPLL